MLVIFSSSDRPPIKFDNVSVTSVKRRSQPQYTIVPSFHWQNNTTPLIAIGSLIKSTSLVRNEVKKNLVDLHKIGE